MGPLIMVHYRDLTTDFDSSESVSGGRCGRARPAVPDPSRLKRSDTAAAS
jgi:hypothetical protein